MPSLDNPWFLRGGSHTFVSDMGIYVFGDGTGKTSGNVSWRVTVLINEKL
ncbi:MAG: hypothetical protein PHY26_04860 [Bacilli bacterium]|jgi:hypothetical protein|nr:hypothetical protein [Bacilli bacterium]